ncbi:MAG: prepilin-type N-terminal cleavage/methylation domain-containing protein [Roseobacter sp.]
MRGRQRDAGVALLEMLIALMIMAMLAAMTASAFGTFGRVLSSVTRGDNRVDWLLSQRQVQNWAQDRPNGFNQGMPIRLTGDKRSIQFQTTDRSGRYWQGALVTIEIRLENTQLIAVVTGQLSPTTKTETTNITLDQGPVSSLEMSYYGKHELDTGARWGTKWSSELHIPKLVKIEWQGPRGVSVPLILELGLTESQSFRSLSSLSPPG